MQTDLAEMADTARFIVDLDGTLIRGGQLVPGASEMLRVIDERFVIVSNNSTDTAASLARSLGHLGLAIEQDRLILAGEHTVRFMAEQYPMARILLIGSRVIRHYAKHRLKLTLVRDGADFVVLARDTNFDYAALTLVVNELRRGARLVVTNPDLSHPADEGQVVPETGTLMKAITACAGVEPTHLIGKPAETLFVEGLKRLRAQPADAVVIGDNLATDAAGASKLGMRFILAGTVEPLCRMSTGVNTVAGPIGASARSLAK